MTFALRYNRRFPLRLVNLAKIYLDAGGQVMIENRAAVKLSKLQIIDFFFPGLFVRELPDDEEAFYDDDSCCIFAPRRQGILSKWGAYKQKINSLEDCLLGNGSEEKQYVNHIASRNMLRRAFTEIESSDASAERIIAHLRNIYLRNLDQKQKEYADRQLAQLIESCHEEEVFQFCTADRPDGFSFTKDTWTQLIDRMDLCLKEGNYADLWAGMCLSALFGNYTAKLIKKYRFDFSAASMENQIREAYRLLSSPSVMARPHFVGREDDLIRLHEMFNDSRAVFLYGIEGIGKTEITKQYIRRYKNEYDTIIYAVYEGSLLNLVIEDTPFEIQPPAARLFNGSGMESDEDYFKRKLSVIKNLATEKTLIVIDNFNTEFDEHLDSLLAGRYRILFTTQYDCSNQYPSLKVNAIEDPEALKDLFMNSYMGYNAERDDPDLLRLIQAVNGHTYTVELLAHHMESSGQSPSQLLSFINSTNSAAGKIRREKYDDIYAQLIRMFEIFEFDQEAQYVLQLLSLMPLSGVEAMEFIRWADLPSAKQLVQLERRGWIIRNTRGIALHPVVRKVIRYVLPADYAELKPFLDRVALEFSEEKSWHYTKTEKDRYALIARNMLECVTAVDENTISFCRAACGLFSYSAHGDEALKLGIQIYEYCDEVYGHHAFETASAAYRIGWTCLFNLQLDQALPKAEEWLNRARKIFEEHTPETVSHRAMYCGVLENLSKAYFFHYESTADQHYLYMAQEYAEQSVALSRRWLSDYKNTGKSPAGSLLRLSDICITLKEYKSAERLIEEAYRILSSMFPDEDHKDPDILRATSRRAKVLFYLGRYEESLAEADKNLAAYREFYGDGNPTQLDQLMLKVNNCYKLGLTDLARSTSQEAARIAKKILAPDTSRFTYLSSLL